MEWMWPVVNLAMPTAMKMVAGQTMGLMLPTVMVVTDGLVIEMTQDLMKKTHTLLW